MNIYDIETPYTSWQTHSVVARNMAEAEKLFILRYGPVTIKEIRLHSEYFLVHGLDDLGCTTK